MNREPASQILGSLTPIVKLASNIIVHRVKAANRRHLGLVLCMGPIGLLLNQLSCACYL
jgi:hypothetical protein